VRDNGEIVGVDEDKIEGIKKDFLTAINNPQKLNPPVYLSADIIEIEDKKIISVFIPESSSVHSVNGRIYDRNGDGDFDITGRSDQVAQLYLRKQNSYTENKIFPFATMEDLKPDLLKKVRQMASNQREDAHPWEGMNDL
jgi:ATP-dependent DNA helicase RecG